jgi:hypothetical protein
MSIPCITSIPCNVRPLPPWDSVHVTLYTHIRTYNMPCALPQLCRHGTLHELPFPVKWRQLKNPHTFVSFSRVCPHRLSWRWYQKGRQCQGHRKWYWWHDSLRPSEQNTLSMYRPPSEWYVPISLHIRLNFFQSLERLNSYVTITIGLHFSSLFLPPWAYILPRRCNMLAHQSLQNPLTHCAFGKVKIFVVC